MDCAFTDTTHVHADCTHGYRIKSTAYGLYNVCTVVTSLAQAAAVIYTTAACAASSNTLEIYKVSMSQ